MDVGSSIRSKHSDRSVYIYIQSDGHFCFLSYRQFLYIDLSIYLYRSMFHLNWPVMESDL